jgi:hypothetical protein
LAQFESKVGKKGKNKFQRWNCQSVGAFTYRSKLPLCFVPHRIKSKDYTDILEDVLIPFFEDSDEDLVFQQDNASIHGSKLTAQWFQLMEIKLLSWSSRSPDLNPIENLWEILASKVYANGRQFASVEELKARIKTCWEEIEVTMIKELVESMPKRIFEVIKSHGGQTKY